MQYDFTTLMDRRGWDAMAVESPGSGVGSMGSVHIDPGFDLIPMWVADMNFPTVPTVPQALAARCAHPAYGYFDARADYYDAILRWQAARHGVEGLEKEHIGFENGVLGGVCSALRTLCSPGEGVLLHSPTYIGFTHALEDNGWRCVLSPLRRDGSGVWRMDLADMEQKLRDGKIHAAILCSPHNPTGRVWERGELEAAMALYEKYDVTVISDEIWADLTLPGYTHIPTQSVSPDARRRTVALYAPSKTFNLAGLIGSYHIIYDPALRHRVERQGAITHYNEQNVLSMHALIAAYSSEGAAWLEELRQVLAGNVRLAMDSLERWEGVEAARPQGTYMLFLDCSGWCRSRGQSLDDLLAAGHRVGVIWQDGRPFHGPQHIRVNLALPQSRVEEALRRLDTYVFRPDGPSGGNIA